MSAVTKIRQCVGCRWCFDKEHWREFHGANGRPSFMFWTCLTALATVNWPIRQERKHFCLVHSLCPFQLMGPLYCDTSFWFSHRPVLFRDKRYHHWAPEGGSFCLSELVVYQFFCYVPHTPQICHFLCFQSEPKNMQLYLAQLIHLSLYSSLFIPANTYVVPGIRTNLILYVMSKGS